MGYTKEILEQLLPMAERLGIEEDVEFYKEELKKFD